MTVFRSSTQHEKEDLIYDPEYLGIQRTNEILFIQITLNAGRTVELKRALYQTIADRLHEQLVVRKEDVFINLVEVTKENWSYGNGNRPVRLRKEGMGWQRFCKEPIHRLARRQDKHTGSLPDR